MENEVHLFRMTHCAKEGLTQLLLGLTFLFVLNSCSKEATLEEVSPASVETTSILKEWATKNDHLNQANLIEWNYSTPITLSDSIKGYAAPVKTESGFKEFITFELGGKRHGWFKTYKRLNETDMEIVIQTVDGRTLRSGFIRKKSTSAPKGKATSMREMNFDTPIDWMLNDYIIGILLDNVTVTAPGLNAGGGFIYFGNNRFDINAFNFNLVAGYFNAVNYGGGNSQYSFADYNYTKITNNLTDPCLNQVFSDLLNRNVYGEINEIISKFNSSVGGNGFSFRIQEMSIMEESIYPTYFGAFDNGTIKINRSLLRNSSKEGIAKTMVHEILHAYIKKDILIVKDHEVMIRDYVLPMAEFLVGMYNIPMEDGILLSLSGLQETSYYVTLLSKMKITNNDVSIMRKLYTENLNYGKRCF